MAYFWAGTAYSTVYMGERGEYGNWGEWGEELGPVEELGPLGFKAMFQCTSLITCKISGFLHV
jgi:hypothetical protein